MGVRRDKEEVEVFDVPFSKLICVEVGVILLYSWVKFVFGLGTPVEIKIPFNTVGIEDFFEAVNFVRGAIDNAQSVASTGHPIAAELPFKYERALRRWLAPGEAVIEMAFHPEIRTRWLGLLQRQVAPPLLTVLTDRQLALITEEPSRWGVKREREGFYGKIFIYCPLSRVDSLELTPRQSDTGLADLCLTLINERARFRINSIVGAESWPQFERLRRSLYYYLAKHAPQHQLTDQTR